MVEPAPIKGLGLAGIGSGCCIVHTLHAGVVKGLLARKVTDRAKSKKTEDCPKADLQPIRLLLPQQCFNI